MGRRGGTMLAGILKGKEEAIAGRWIELVCRTYPQETTQFLEVERDPFSNPVGRMLREAAGPLVRALLDDGPDGDFPDGLAELMRLRSVQDMTAAQAVGIVTMLRKAVMDVAGDSIQSGGTPAMEELGRRIEELMLVAFDAFVLSRERLYEIRIAERERHTASLLRRAEKVLDGLVAQETGRGNGEDAPVAGR